MRQARVAHILGLLVIPLAATFTTLCNAQNLDTRKDEEAIRALIVEMTEGFNSHDSKAATRMYTPDADFVTVRGEAFKGTVDFEKGLGSILATRAKEARLKTLDVRIRFIRPDVALAHVTNELSGLLSPDGQQLSAQKELSIRVFVKDGDDWHVTAFHNTMIRPFGAPETQR
jgi:uncharacterized protein (TIGR02246 family)